MNNIKLWGSLLDHTNYITSSAYTEPYIGYVPASDDYIRGMQGTPANVFLMHHHRRKAMMMPVQVI